MAISQNQPTMIDPGGPAHSPPVSHAECCAQPEIDPFAGDCADLCSHFGPQGALEDVLCAAKLDEEVFLSAKEQPQVFVHVSGSGKDCRVNALHQPSHCHCPVGHASGLTTPCTAFT